MGSGRSKPESLKNAEPKSVDDHLVLIKRLQDTEAENLRLKQNLQGAERLDDARKDIEWLKERLQATEIENTALRTQLQGTCHKIMEQLTSRSEASDKKSATAEAQAQKIPNPFESTSQADPSLYGTKLFVGAVADKYLKKHGESAALLSDHSWPNNKADVVAAALLDWGRDQGATSVSHWFQPLGATMVRHGLSAQVLTCTLTFDKEGKPDFSLSGAALVRGESDGSSFPNGGLRATHTAAGYTVIDPTSPVFIRGDAMLVPAVFVSWNGHALDEKAPLLRSLDALAREGRRLLGHLGWTVASVLPNIGLEQEFFLVPRDAYARRPDLQLCGRTVMGRMPARGQEMSDHYMAPVSPHVTRCLREIQEECYRVGIPLRTRHREVAPNQHEFAPMFGVATTQVDQNLLVMQIADEVCARHGLACLMHEKPFAGVNGSGKHNNWSLGTPDGINLLNATQVSQASGNPLVFPVVMAAIIDAVDRHGDLFRLAVASPGNDFRLGACEAPPAILSTYLGEDLTQFLDAFRAGGQTGEYCPARKAMTAGVAAVPAFEVPSEDRNRTSPFPYGGHRFEFRAVGSSQHVGFVNTVLCTATADAFARFSDAIEAGRAPREVAAEALASAWKCIFNGDGYAAAWREEADRRGVWRIDSGVEAVDRLGATKNVELFARARVMTPAETAARRRVMLEHYAGLVEMEAGCMVDIIRQRLVPAVTRAGRGEDASALEAALTSVEAGLHGVHAAGDELERARLARTLRLETMEAARAACDTAEARCPADVWPLPTYKELLFLDLNQDGLGRTV